MPEAQPLSGSRLSDRICNEVRFKQWEAFTLIPDAPAIPRYYVPFLTTTIHDQTVFAYVDKSSGGTPPPRLRCGCAAAALCIWLTPIFGCSEGVVCECAVGVGPDDPRMFSHIEVSAAHIVLYLQCSIALYSELCGYSTVWVAN